MDIDTDRRINPIGNPGKIKPTLSTISIEENGSNRTFKVKSMSVEIDTSKDTPYIWMDCELENESTSNTSNRIVLMNINLNVDSIALSGNPFRLLGTNYNESYAKLKVERGVNMSFDTVFFSDDKNTSDVVFSLNKKKKEVWSYLYTKVYDYKLVRTTIDSTIYDTTYKNRIDTIWTSPTNYELKEVTDTIVTDTHLSFEKDIRYKDSLIVNGRLKFVY